MCQYQQQTVTAKTLRERTVTLWRSISSLTYPDYDSASMRYSFEVNVKPASLMTTENLLPVFKCSMKMLFYVICPYILIVFIYIYFSALCKLYNTPILENYWIPNSALSDFKFLSYQLVAYLTIIVAIISHFYLIPAKSPLNGQSGTSIYGATNKPGLYYSKHSKFMSRVVHDCKYLSSPHSQEGALHYTGNVGPDGRKSFSLFPTPWLLNGKIHTA